MVMLDSSWTSSGMDSRYERDDPLMIRPVNNDRSSRSSSSGNSIEDLEQVETLAKEILVQPRSQKSVSFASPNSSNISLEEHLQRKLNAARKSREDIPSVRTNQDKPVKEAKINQNIPFRPKENENNQRALGEFDDDASSIISYRSEETASRLSFLVPASPLSDITADLTPYSLSPMQSPSLQVMDRSGTPKNYQIPSAVFARNSSPPVEWSIASNESLFSLHIKNHSFTKDRLVVVNNDAPKSCELGKSIELITTSGGINMEKIFQANKATNILEDISEGCKAKQSEDLSPVVTLNSSCYSESAGALSFSKPGKKRCSSKSSMWGIRGILCCHKMNCASPSCCCSNYSPACSYCDNGSPKRLCCSILLCSLLEVANCCISKKTQQPKASSKSDSNECFPCSCSTCNSCCTCPCSSCCTCCSCKPYCSWPSGHSCCSHRPCSCPSCKSCCYSPSCTSCCTCSCSCPSCKSCCYCSSCTSCCTFPSCRRCHCFPSCHSCFSCPSCITYSCHCC